jgi:hypothetical protein
MIQMGDPNGDGTGGTSIWGGEFQVGSVTFTVFFLCFCVFFCVYLWLFVQMGDPNGNGACGPIIWGGELQVGSTTHSRMSLVFLWRALPLLANTHALLLCCLP